MPKPGQQWWHVILNTHGSWLHGDPRGFRSRGHRIHSSGDYKHRPPEGEHAGLHAYQMARCPDAVKIPDELHDTVGLALVNKLKKQKHRLVALGVDATHAHLLCELPAATSSEVNKLAATWKQAASHAVRDQLSGRVWGAGGRPTAIQDRKHHEAVYRYILRHAEDGAWVWAYSEDGAC